MSVAAPHDAAAPHDDAAAAPHDATAPFEGPEKLLEIWFAPSPDELPDTARAPDERGRTGLRKVPRQTWEDMLDIVQCKVLSAVHGSDLDAYLLSESSFFVSPHRLILKTCGTTLNLYGLPRILAIAAEYALPRVYRLFYSRKSFMFPDRQLGPHRNWSDEVSYLDALVPNGAAYTVGKVNGDHWLLYLTSPGGPDAPDTAPPSPVVTSFPLARTEDYTIEILMTDLAPAARKPFFATPEQAPSVHAQALSTELGISDLFPRHLTTLDAYSFSPCGYSSNALLRWGASPSDIGPADSAPGGEGYYTIHVTPEDGWSYASFECNVPLAHTPSPQPATIPDLQTLVRRVVRIFQPGRLTLTLFVSSADNNADEAGEPSAVDVAQRVFRAALAGPDAPGAGHYRRTDKINYEFGGYDLAFASFELRP